MAEAITGVQRIVDVNRVVVCKGCQGRRVKPLKTQKECSSCHGSGESSTTTGDICGTCYGSGLDSETCESCMGDGLIEENVRMLAKVPRSVDTGMLLRIRGKGNEALNGKPGDLIIVVYV